MRQPILLFWLLLPFYGFSEDTSWTIFTVADSDLPNNSVADIAFDNSGKAWVATWGGLAVYEEEKWQVFHTANSGIPTDLVNHVAFDAFGSVWIATNGNGIVKYDGRSWSSVNLPGANIALTIEVDPYGRKWVGTFTDGLYLYDGRAPKKIWGGTGSLEYNVNDILFDNTQAHVATPIGVVSFDLEKPDDGGKVTYDGHVFDLDRTKDGVVWLATLPVGRLAHRKGRRWQELNYITTADSDRMSSYHLQSVKVFPSGAVLTGTPTRGELARYHEEKWSRILTPFADAMKEGISAVEIDAQNNIWVGTWGEGLMISNRYATDEDSVVLEEIVEQGTLEDREIEEQSTIVCNSRNVTINLWDKNKEDGDTVSVSLNGKWLVRNLGLVNKRSSYDITLENNFDSYLILHAENLGKIPPNTAAMEVIDGDKTHRVTLSSDLEKSGTIRLVYRSGN